jgi:amino acid transporter
VASRPPEPPGPQPKLTGLKPGDRRVRVERPRARYFRYAGPGVLVAKPPAELPRTPAGRLWMQLKRVLIGRPLATEEEIEERLSKKKALAIFSSDAISSSAYATEEILRVLIVAGTAAVFFSFQIAIAIALLLAVVSTSYRQICYAYPSGGGAYAVARVNLGRGAALVAAAALLIDYVMTVAVSTSSAVDQITSAIPELYPESVLLGVVGVAVIALANLRGLRESGNIFAVPTYLFVGTALLMVALGSYRVLVLGEHAPAPALPAASDPLAALGPLLVLRAFAAGSVALTGTEAIANGVPAFKPPEPRNAATTLTAMAILLGVLFVGITFVADSFGIVPLPEQTVVAQVAAVVFGPASVGFYLFQAFTALILFLAANTSFNAFPRLAAILAEDGYMPRHFAFRGDRLAFTVGVLLLGGIAGFLLIVFGGDTHALIPLYSVGVFVSFTISQAGMVRHWLDRRGPRWLYRLGLNAFGCTLTAVVAVVVTVAKQPESLLVAVLIPALVGGMLFISREYRELGRQIDVRPDLVFETPRKRQRVVVPVPWLTRAVVQAVNFGRTISRDVLAVHVTADAEEGEKLRTRFERQLPGVPFVIVESPYRSIVSPFLTYLDVMGGDDDVVTIVVLPEFVARHWWERMLYNQTARRIREALIGRPNTVVANVPYRREP